jgi:ArsR family transcriptional regulator
MSKLDRIEAAALERRAAKVADILRAIGNERRLLILCKLVEWGEAKVGSLTAAVGLSQSALSQHLAKMRGEGIVAFRRESQTVWYRIADPRIEQLISTLHDLFCRPVVKTSKKGLDHEARGRSPRDDDEHARDWCPGARRRQTTWRLK